MNESIYTTENEIENHVYDEYRKYDTELNGLFFDFPVKAPEKVLLFAYANIQKNINGDSVMRLENPEIEETNEPNDNIWGKDVDLIPEGEYEDIYEGNMKDFLESFNGRELETGLCRVMDVEEKGELIGGIKLDFVF